MRPQVQGWAALLAVAATGCDFDQSRFFPDAIEGVPGVQDLGTLVPADLTTEEEIRASIVYGELGPTGDERISGVTFEFLGVGGSVCILVDPETVFWNEAVSPTAPKDQFSFPDNVYDDGDLDLFAGYSVYYTGVPGERLGDFEIRYQDSLENAVPVKVNLCTQQDFFGTGLGHSGRASPEFCTIADTLPGKPYRVMMSAFSLALDDDRLGYGLLITKGSCVGTPDDPRGLFDVMGVSEDPHAVPDVMQAVECIIRGESIEPGHEQGPKALKAGITPGLPTWLGQDEAPSWERSEAFEQAFCRGRPSSAEARDGLKNFCVQERNRVREARSRCSWEFDPNVEGNGERCFCGDEIDSPDGGIF